MPPLNPVPFSELDRILRQLGFEPSRRRGSHVRYRHADGRRTTLPDHGSEPIGRGHLRQILRDIELTVKQYEALRLSR